MVGEEKEREKPQVIVRSESEDVEELRGVLSAVSDFIAQLKDSVREFIDMLSSSLDGEKIGREVAEFYRQLKESGVPDEVATEMTKKFFEERMKAAPKIGSLIDAFKDMLTWKEKYKGREGEDVEENIERLEQTKEMLKDLNLPEEKRRDIEEKIDVALRVLKELRKEKKKER